MFVGAACGKVTIKDVRRMQNMMKDSEQMTCKTVLCYGDSNTYGYDPSTDSRYARNVRWPGRLQLLLGNGYNVIEEGCNGRTTVFDDPEDDWKNGIRYLKTCLYSHKPLDIMILMLGTNDLKDVFHATPEDIAGGIEEMVKLVRDFTKDTQGFIPRIIVAAPARIGDGIAKSPFKDSFSEKTVEYSGALPGLYLKVAERYGCEFVNAAEYARPSEIDSVHFMPEDHDNLANAFYNAIMSGK